ncbi:MAG TPA: hypothetical protein VJ974_05175 [Geopsychrobacteraceae bacterium]|nr:hypothetical protein [Geopsychrobacteraceae bacterium]
MLKLVRWLVWLLVSLIVLTGLDQTLVRVPMKVPVLEQFQSFYVDFRGRLLGLTSRQVKQYSVEQVIETTEKQVAPSAKVAGPRFLYVDDSGALQFADSLDAVPEPYRKDAQPMEQ